MTSELGYNTNLIRWMTIYIDMQANKTLFTLSVLSFLFLEKINILVNICFVFNKISFQFSFKKKKRYPFNLFSKQNTKLKIQYKNIMFNIT